MPLIEPFELALGGLDKIIGFVGGVKLVQDNNSLLTVLRIIDFLFWISSHSLFNFKICLPSLLTSKSKLCSVNTTSLTVIPISIATFLIIKGLLISMHSLIFWATLNFQ
eukprot:NODE_827_length_3663_cov_1.497755.p5 type:complete len:109 gc:universal NODE_827_length_3663_cov_1.497755:2092-2418(+)